MTAILEILAKIWPFILAGLGVLFGWMRHKQAQTTTARAEKQVAEAEKREAQVGAAVAQANEKAAQAGANAVKERRDVEERIETAGPGESRRVLDAEWSRD